MTRGPSTVKPSASRTASSLRMTESGWLDDKLGLAQDDKLELAQDDRIGSARVTTGKKLVGHQRRRGGQQAGRHFQIVEIFAAEVGRELRVERLARNLDYTHHIR